jgi:hypothetical protein
MKEVVRDEWADVLDALSAAMARHKATSQGPGNKRPFITVTVRFSLSLSLSLMLGPFPPANACHVCVAACLLCTSGACGNIVHGLG